MIRGTNRREVGGEEMSAGEREEARGEAWSRQVRTARRAVTRAITENKIDAADWEAYAGMYRSAHKSGRGGRRRSRT